MPPASVMLALWATVLAAASRRVTALRPAPVVPGAVTLIVPVKSFSPLKMIVPLLLALRVRVALPLIAFARVSGEVLSPLFLSRRLFVPRVHVLVVTTGVLGSAAKLTPVLLTEQVKKLSIVIVWPPEPSSGANVVPEAPGGTARLMKFVPKEELLPK